MNPRLMLASLGLIGLVSVSPASAGPAFTRVSIYPDTSGSLQAMEFQSVLRRLSAALPEIVEALGLSRVELQPWSTGQDAWASSMLSVRVQPRLVSAPASVKATEAGQIFKIHKDKTEEAAMRALEAQERTASAAYRAALVDSLAPVQHALCALRQGDAACSAVGELLRRVSAARSSEIVCIVTDGVDDCGWRYIQPENRSVAGTIVVILVPNRQDHQPVSRALAQARSQILAVVPNAHVISSFQVTDRPDQWLFPLLQDGSVGGPKS